MTEAEFPKDEGTVPVSERACLRLLSVLQALGIDPEVTTNPVDAAAFILEAIVDAKDRINSAPSIKDTVLELANDPEEVQKSLEAFDKQVGALTVDDVRTEVHVHDFQQLFADESPQCTKCGEIEVQDLSGGCMGDSELGALHEPGCVFWDARTDHAPSCTCGLDER